MAFGSPQCWLWGSLWCRGFRMSCCLVEGTGGHVVPSQGRVRSIWNGRFLSPYCSAATASLRTDVTAFQTTDKRLSVAADEQRRESCLRQWDGRSTCFCADDGDDNRAVGSNAYSATLFEMLLISLLTHHLITGCFDQRTVLLKHCFCCAPFLWRCQFTYLHSDTVKGNIGVWCRTIFMLCVKGWCREYAAAQQS